MHKLQQKILEMDFGKALKRWLILVICVLVFSGGISAMLLQTQIKEVIAVRNDKENLTETRGQTAEGD